MRIFLRNALSLFILSVFLLSCSKDDGGKEEVTPGFKGYITSFKAGTSNKTLNDFFVNYALGTITNKLPLHYSTDLSQFIVVFDTNSTEGNEVTVKIGDAVQNSGDVVDLTNGVVYDIYVGGEKNNSFTLTVATTKAPNYFKSFAFAEESMSPYEATISSSSGKLIFDDIDPTINITSLTPVFTTLKSDAVVKVNGVVQESGVTTHDFSRDAVEYTIESEGKTNSFTVKLIKKSVPYTNPVNTGAYADPTVIRVGNMFYVYVTDGEKTRGYESNDLVTWNYITGSVDNGRYVMSEKPAFTDDDPSDKPGIWAPDINYFDNRYVLYYSISKWGGGATAGIGVAVSDNPGGPFTPPPGNSNGKLFVSSEIGVHNSIDPNFFEENGKRYLFWGSFNGIYMTELTSDGMEVADLSQKTRVAGNAFEAVYIHKKNDYYYMFTSAGSCCEGKSSTYRVTVGRSRYLTGPYLNKNNKKMTDFDLWNAPNFPSTLQGKNTEFAGPGHNSRIITDDLGQDWILYHSYAVDASGNTNQRNLMLDKVNWDASGWPVIGRNAYPTLTTGRPYFYHKVNQ